MSEFEIKQGRIIALLEKYNLDALLLQRVSSFAWATCGSSSYINTAASDGVASLLITRDRRALFTNNIEAPRLEKEEKLVEQGWEFCIKSWYESTDQVAQSMKGLKVGADFPLPGGTDLSVDVARLRAQLTQEEGARIRSLGKLCAEAMYNVIIKVQPGQSESYIAANLSLECEQRGVQAIANMVATDERISSFRHPLPTEKKLQKYAMVVLCGRKWGLVSSISRLVHFGPIDTEIRQKANAVGRIDAAFLAATRPGQTLATIFQKGAQAYEDEGFPLEWQHHHQGGSAGYEPREFVAVPGLEEPVISGQAFAWNPSLPGVKCEDTILVGDSCVEIVTKIEDWPLLDVEIDGSFYRRPDILELC
jgi:Xaa-Pro aminopeptidase